MAGTSSFTEGSSVFGGQANLIQALNNMFTIYNPDIVAIHTTCLSETIGDDITQIAEKAVADGKVPKGKYIIHCNTPSYVGSHVTGYANMVKGMVKHLSENSKPSNKKLNIITGWVEPSDMREIKRLCSTMGVEIIMFPDTSDVLDAPLIGKHEFYPRGGTTIEELKDSGNSMASIAIGEWATKDAAIALQNKCKVKFEVIELPIGLKATDRFIMELSKYGKVSVPEAINDERGKLIDVITDMHQYLHGKRVALWGDPDQLIPLTEFLVDLDMKPVYIVSGTPGKYFTRRIEAALDGKVPEAKYRNGKQADMFLMHQWIKQEPVDLLIGNTYGKYIARDENIPFVRMGFPILDRIGHSYFPHVGYMGAIRLLEQILNVFLDKKDAESPEEKFELVL
jgi:nitrogenase molybdenum-iron protein beta chain